LTPFYLISFAVSLLFSLILTWWVRILTTGRGWMASIQDRALHESRPSPLGGVPIFFSLLVSVAVAMLARLHSPALAAGLLTRTLLTVLLPGTLVFLVGCTTTSIS
jgi:UDP-N-acetylmuramyl pentapeptide phosphotransferase/UDP-N-acetylglucosamine-1-phosphate transferase